MRRWIAATLALLVVALAGCGRSGSGAGEGYCEVVVATQQDAATAKAQNASGTPRSETAIPSILASRSEAAPSELELAWMAVLAGPGMESDGTRSDEKSRDFEAGLATIGRYDEEHCGVTTDLAPPRSVTVR